MPKSNHGHTLKRFDEELSALKNQVLALGGLVEMALANAMQALANRDTDLAQKTIERDKAINALEVQCDDLTRRMLVLRQPAAGDLRFIISAIKTVTDLERMGDLAAGICEGVLHMDEHKTAQQPNPTVLWEKVRDQVSLALDALSRDDTRLAMQVIEQDNVVDAAYQSFYRAMLTYMLEDPRGLGGYIILSNVAKNLERIGDHATNICEMVIYTARGHDIRHVDHEAAAALLRGEE